jgi:two-component system, LuxR family, response regulator FixJ
MAAPGTDKEIILVVDDDDAVRDSMRLLLESYGMAVKDYGSAREFLSDQPKSENCCLLLDLHMPEMGGFELLDQLRSRGITIPVIAITGRGDPALRKRVTEAGALGLLLKPVDDEELIDAINLALHAGTFAR